MCIPLLPLLGITLGFAAVCLAVTSIARQRFVLSRHRTLTGEPAMIAGAICAAISVALIAAIITIVFLFPEGMGH
jgi:hypothetical protein